MSRGVGTPNLHQTVTLRTAEDVAEQTLKTMQSGTDSNWKEEAVFATKLVQGRWEILERIGSGGFGAIFKAYDTHTHTHVAIKVEKRQCKCYLDKEVAFYATLDQSRRPNAMNPAPRCHFAGTEGGYRIAVFDLMGESLSDLFYRCGRKFSLKTVLMLGQQLVTRLEAVHEAGIVHRDVKPGNFVMGRGEEAGTVFVIDFGLSNMWRTSNGGHIQFNIESPFRGTHRYASVNSHRKFEQSRRDDLEAIAYVLIYFINGGLPWQSLRVTRNKRRKAIGLSKAGVTPEALCENLPPQFTEFLKYVKSLQFEQTPDYQYCRHLFRTCFEESGFHDDGIWDWDLPTPLGTQHLTSPSHASAAHGSNPSQLSSSAHLHPSQLSNSIALASSTISVSHSSHYPSAGAYPQPIGPSHHHHHPQQHARHHSGHHNAQQPHQHLPQRSQQHGGVLSLHIPSAARGMPGATPASANGPVRATTATPGALPNASRSASRRSAVAGGSSPSNVPGTSSRACVNLAMPLTTQNGANPAPHKGVMRATGLGQTANAGNEAGVASFGSIAGFQAQGQTQAAPTYASMLRSSNGSPIPMDSIAYLDYCNSQTPQTLSSASFGPTSSMSSSTSSATAGGAQSTSSGDFGVPHHPHSLHHMSTTSRNLRVVKLKTDAHASHAHQQQVQQSTPLYDFASLNGPADAWGACSSANTSTASLPALHSASSPMLGSAYESAAASASSSSYATPTATFVSTHLLQLGSPVHHHHQQHQSQLQQAPYHHAGLGYSHHTTTSCAVPSSPTNSFPLNMPSSPLLQDASPSPLMHFSSLLDEDTLFSTNSLPAFSTISSSASAGQSLFSRSGLASSSSSTIMAPITTDTSISSPSNNNTTNSLLVASELEQSSSNLAASTNTLVSSSAADSQLQSTTSQVSGTIAPDSPSSSTRPGSPMTIGAHSWGTNGSTSPLPGNEGETDADAHDIELSHHHLHDADVVLAIDDGMTCASEQQVVANDFVASLEDDNATAALVCVETTIVNPKKRSRAGVVTDIGVPALNEPRCKRRSSRLIEKDFPTPNVWAMQE